MLERECYTCKTKKTFEFNRPPFYCSEACTPPDINEIMAPLSGGGERARARAGLKVVGCVFCKNLFVKPDTKGVTIFCSDTCKRNDRLNKIKVSKAEKKTERVCVGCQFRRPMARRQKYCSRQCWLVIFNESKRKI